MKVISYEEIKIREKALLEKYQNYKKMDAYKTIKRYMPWIHIVILIVSTVFAMKMPQTYMEWLRDIREPLILGKILAGLKAIGLIILVMVVMVPIHEVLHAIPLGIQECYMIMNLPKSISVYCDKWHSKKRDMISMICPFVFFTLIDVFFCILSGMWYLGVFFMMINIATASTDIFMFFYIMRKVPKNSLVFGYYYVPNNS